MKLSNKGRYGVRAVFDIAYHNRGGATQIKEIAERQAIPPRFLEQIFQDLKRAGLVTSKRGPRGGYQLAKEAAHIRVGDVVRALEGPVVLCDATASGAAASEATAKRGGAEGGDATSRAITEQAFSQISKNIEACFDALTIDDLCIRGEEAGVSRAPKNRYVYSI